MYAVTFSPDGRLLAAASAGGTTHLYDTTDRTHTTPIYYSQGPAAAAAPRASAEALARAAVRPLL
ncbi:WD40 repeat domain-containing protein [Micromonospora sp. KC207]|uniref:WD40 repeat domain-containing protein n=1 Tax=Micromonospora sp. KC207 TaxID=2530377 RepID=UPI001046F207|nr:WD40 repeat domain-containing protein [Micromonospora sp. KC207]